MWHTIRSFIICRLKENEAQWRSMFLPFQGLVKVLGFGHGLGLGGELLPRQHACLLCCYLTNLQAQRDKSPVCSFSLSCAESKACSEKRRLPPMTIWHRPAQRPAPGLHLHHDASSRRQGHPHRLRERGAVEVFAELALTAMGHSKVQRAQRQLRTACISGDLM